MGLSGRSAAKFLLSQGALVFGFDQNPSLLQEDEEIDRMRFLGLVTDGNDDFIYIYQFTLVVVSPGFSQTEIHYLQALKAGIEVIGEMELALRYIKNPSVAITGTNGKTTVTLLIEHILQLSGRKAVAVGNIGKPLTSYLSNDHDSNDILVIELSSYQIETLSTK